MTTDQRHASVVPTRIDRSLTIVDADEATTQSARQFVADFYRSQEKMAFAQQNADDVLRGEKDREPPVQAVLRAIMTPRRAGERPTPPADPVEFLARAICDDRRSGQGLDPLPAEVWTTLWGQHLELQSEYGDYGLTLMSDLDAAARAALAALSPWITFTVAQIDLPRRNA